MNCQCRLIQHSSAVNIARSGELDGFNPISLDQTVAGAGVDKRALLLFFLNLSMQGSYATALKIFTIILIAENYGLNAQSFSFADNFDITDLLARLLNNSAISLSPDHYQFAHSHSSL